ncbi:PEGA domain-containing protein [Cystobacter fuscus]|uniref:PEGA domain-containing protein n=1 Tax=Cystobacter fuscus TaxID=43 RepID=A0A250IWU2_9BACT|nr:PEGA domain-containing protein [Cystobacter fuscus]ATB35758.1 PEGA domain-containing protein [Cystobacter fuscus]
MRNPFVVAAVLLALASGPASAQGGFGLDLSSEPNAQQSNEQTEESSEEASPDSGAMGLDLSSGPGADLMPRFGLVGLDTPERAGAAAAKRWVGWLQGVAFRTGKVVRAATPAEARQNLGNDYATTLRCSEASCLSGAADTLDADLLTTARLSLEDEGWTLRLWTFDRDKGVVETDVVTGRKPTDSTFIREAGETLARRVTTLARPRAMLKVASNVSRAVVRVGSRVLGVGNVEAKLPPGDNQLVVEADDYNTYTKTVTLAPGETKELSVRLEFGGAAPESPLAELDERTPAKKKKSGSSNPTIFSRPALYTTVLGLAAVGAGVAMGLPLQQRTLKIDRQGVVDIHRGEYASMRQQALISTALMAGGGAVAAGSLAWLIIVPQRSAPASSSVAPVAGGTGGSGRGDMALHLVFGGSF